jgi:hypothetical protein
MDIDQPTFCEDLDVFGDGGSADIKTVSYRVQVE